MADPAAFRFRGDTLGIDLSLAWIGPLFFGGFALLATYWSRATCMRASGVHEGGPRGRS